MSVLCQRTWSQLLEAIGSKTYLKMGKETDLGERLANGEERDVALQIVDDHFPSMYDHIRNSVGADWFSLPDLEPLYSHLWPKITERSARRRMRNILSILSAAGLIELCRGNQISYRLISEC